MNCLVCHREIDELWATAVDVEYGSSADEYRYFRCDRCDCLCIDPVPVERLAEIYPPSYYSFASGERGRASLATRAKAALDARRFRRVMSMAGEPAPRILDVGGGTGLISEGFVRASGGRGRATVVDFDRESIEVARARGLEGHVSRFEDFQTDQRFHVILMLNLIEHVSDPPAILARGRELLEPGGIIWLQTPNYRSLDARLFRHHNWCGLHCPRHWVVFGDHGLRAALAGAGLETLAFDYTQAAYFWAASILGLRRGRSIGDRGEPPTPPISSPAFLPLAAAAAGFDFATRRLRSTSQVIVLARAR